MNKPRLIIEETDKGDLLVRLADVQEFHALDEKIDKALEASELGEGC